MSVSTLCPSAEPAVPQPEPADASHLLLIRHAASDCTRNGQILLCGSYDAPLSSAGQAEILRLSARLASDPATALYSSPLRRAISTADAAPPALRARMRVLRSLAEVDCGLLDGLAIESVRRDYAGI